MVYDPHDDTFIAKNLRQEEWREYQHDKDVAEIAETIKETVANGMVARISHDTLYNLGVEVAMSATIHPVLIQNSFHDHWAAIALCMLTHTQVEVSDFYRFSKSPHEQEPMYYNNIEYVKFDGIPWLVPVRRSNEVKDTRPTWYRKNNKTTRVSGEGDSTGNTSSQGSLFDFH